MNSVTRSGWLVLCMLVWLPGLVFAEAAAPGAGRLGSSLGGTMVFAQRGVSSEYRAGLSPETIEQNMTREMIQQLPADLRAQFLEESALAQSQEAEDGVRDQKGGDEDTREEYSLKVQSDEVSVLEDLYRHNYDTASAGDLSQFGYKLFGSSRATPSRLAVPDDRYVLGPNDELSIRIWGAGLDAEFKGYVKKDGTINVPKIGIVPVAGVRYGQVEELIKREAEKYIQGINVSVALERLRTMEVYVLGEVGEPGLHLVPAFSTVLGGLISARGIAKGGSLRHVYLLRNGHKIPIDLYDLILKGSRTSDRILENRDIIFVPRIGATIGVAGAVGRPAIYEVRQETTLGDLVNLAGHVLPQGFTGRLYVRRYQKNEAFVVHDIDTLQNPDWKTIALQDGDLVDVQFLSPAWPKVVRLEGHVWRPDVYRFVPDLKLSDVLTSPELIKPDAVLDYAFLHRYDPVTTRYSVTTFPLHKVFDHAFDQALRPYDRIQILSRKEYGMQYEVSVRGAVWKPGSYLFHEGMTLNDLLSLAGREKRGARIDHIELTRQHVTGTMAESQHIRLSYANDAQFKLVPFDSVFVPQVKDADKIQTVTLGGEFLYPGNYTIRDGERLSDLIVRAGGFTKEAYFFGAKFTSPRSRAIQVKALQDMIQELEIRANQATVLSGQSSLDKGEADIAQASLAAVQGFISKLSQIQPEGRVSLVLSDLESFKGSLYDFKLEDGDALYVPKRPNYVAVMGSVYAPSAYAYQPTLDVEAYLDKSGGPTKTADEDAVYVLRANGEVLSRATSGSVLSRFDSTTLMPGDTVVVPVDFERVPYLRMIRNVSDIVFKIATTAGIAIAAL